MESTDPGVSQVSAPAATSLSLAVLVLLAGGGTGLLAEHLLRSTLDTRKIQAAGILAEFHTTCLRRRAKTNGGSDLVMDPATEDKLVGYCDCVADALPARISAKELENLGLGEQDEVTTQAIRRHRRRMPGEASAIGHRQEADGWFSQQDSPPSTTSTVPVT